MTLAQMRELGYNYTSSNRINSDRSAASTVSGLATTYMGGSYMDHSTPQPSALKVCSKCLESKPLTEFRFHKTGRMAGKPRSYCMECDLESCRAYKERQRDRLNGEYRDRIANDPEYRKKRNDKSRAWRERKRGHISEYNAARYDTEPEKMRSAVRASENKYPEKRAARKAVYYAVQVGKLPPAWSMVCELCREAQAGQYHHHNGYAPEHKLDVIALCTECHGKAHWVD